MLVQAHRRLGLRLWPAETLLDTGQLGFGLTIVGMIPSIPMATPFCAPVTARSPMFGLCYRSSRWEYNALRTSHLSDSSPTCVSSLLVILKLLSAHFIQG
jgi:hypothetical protein